MTRHPAGGDAERMQWAQLADWAAATTRNDRDARAEFERAIHTTEGARWSGSPDRPAAPSVAEIAELTARLRALSAAGSAADPAERAAFLADKQALLDRIHAGERSPAEPAPAASGPDEFDAAWSDAPSALADPVSVAMPAEWLAEVERRRAEPGRPDSREERAGRIAELHDRGGRTPEDPLDQARPAVDRLSDSRPGLDHGPERRDQLALWQTDDHLHGRVGGNVQGRVHADEDGAGWSR
jgi:hypothetical protein